MDNIHTTDAEYALRRALDYLAAHGQSLDTATVLAVIKIIEEGLSSQQENLLAWLIPQLEIHFPLGCPSPTITQPALHRGSIGFGKSA